MDDPGPGKEEIGIGDFDRVDLRIARVVSAPAAEGLKRPSRVMTLDLGPLGRRQSVGQYALVPEAELVDRHVVVCVNLGTRRIGRYVSEALVLGGPHPDNPDGQAQAIPLYVDGRVPPGSVVF